MPSAKKTNKAKPSKPKLTPEKTPGQIAYAVSRTIRSWIIHVLEVGAYYFEGIPKQAKEESNRLYKLHEKKHKTRIRFADPEEIAQKKSLRNFKGSDWSCVKYKRSGATYDEVIKMMGIKPTKDQKERAFAAAAKELGINKKIKETQIKRRDAELEKYRKARLRAIPLQQK